MIKKIPVIFAILVLILDLFTKYWVKTNITPDNPVEVWDFLTIHFGEVDITPLIYRIFILLVTGLSIFIIFWRKHWIILPINPIYFIISGIVGNQIYDIKIVKTLRWIPTFNLADSCIVISTIVMLLLLLSNKKVHKRRER